MIDVNLTILMECAEVIVSKIGSKQKINSKRLNNVLSKEKEINAQS